jgi:TraY domain
MRFSPQFTEEVGMEDDDKKPVRHSLYYPGWVYRRLREAAKAADRSLNAEVRHRLKASLQAEANS